MKTQGAIEELDKLICEKLKEEKQIEEVSSNNNIASDVGNPVPC